MNQALNFCLINYKVVYTWHLTKLSLCLAFLVSRVGKYCFMDHFKLIDSVSQILTRFSFTSSIQDNAELMSSLFISYNTIIVWIPETLLHALTFFKLSSAEFFTIENGKILLLIIFIGVLIFFLFSFLVSPPYLFTCKL